MRILILFCIFTLLTGCQKGKKDTRVEVEEELALPAMVVSEETEYSDLSVYSLGLVGYDLQQTKEYIQLLEIKKKENCEETFIKLTESDDPAELLYGLPGLKLIKSPLFEVQCQKHNQNAKYVLFALSGRFFSRYMVKDIIPVLKKLDLNEKP